MDLLLDSTTHDIVFDGSAQVTSNITEALSQRLKIKLLTFMGEWYLDEDYGTPYYQSILGKNRDKATIDAILQNIIREDEYVKQIIEFTSVKTNTREYSLSFRVQDTSGNITDNINIITVG
jgi:hypothetical protein